MAPQYFCVTFTFWSCCLKIQKSGAIFYNFICQHIVWIQCIDLCASSLVFSTPMWFRCSCFSALSLALQVLFFHLSLQCCLWLQSYLWITSIAAHFSVPQLWLMASHVVWVVTAFWCAHNLALLLLFVLLLCSLVYCYMTVVWMVMDMPRIGYSYVILLYL